MLLIYLKIINLRYLENERRKKCNNDNYLID